MKEEIIKLCDFIMENKACKICGGTKSGNGCCDYCAKEDLEFKNAIESLLKSLKHCEFDKDILLRLFSIKWLRCNEIDEIIERYDLESFLKNKFSEIANKINSDMVTSDDCKYIIYFLNNHNFRQEDVLTVTSFTVAKLICKKIELSISDSLFLIKHYAESFIKKINPTMREPKCIYKNMDSNIAGDSSFGDIHLNRDYIITSLNNHDYADLLETVFHECAHTNQDYRRNNIRSFGFNTYSNLLSSKEQAICIKFDGYYKENYLKYSDEVEARFMQRVLLLEFLKFKNLKLKDEETKELINKIKQEAELFEDETRKLQGKTTTVDEIFDSLQISPDFLEKFPALKFEYKVINDKVVRKTKEDLMKDYLEQDVSDEKKASFDFLYKKLITKAQLLESSHNNQIL